MFGAESTRYTAYFLHQKRAEAGEWWNGPFTPSRKPRLKVAMSVWSWCARGWAADCAAFGEAAVLGISPAPAGRTGSCGAVFGRLVTTPGRRR